MHREQALEYRTGAFCCLALSAGESGINKTSSNTLSNLQWRVRRNWAGVWPVQRLKALRNARSSE